MWADSEIEIDLDIHSIWGVPNIIDQTYCDDDPSPWKQYSTWLIGDTFSSADAYQLWTAKDLKKDVSWRPDGAYCFGQAKHSTVKDGNEAASVVEGADYCCSDVYDPDEVHERGIVSGHEFAHIYGEETDYPTCTSSCHIMEGGDPGVRQFLFIEQTKKEIHEEFYYGQDAPG